MLVNQVMIVIVILIALFDKALGNMPKECIPTNHMRLLEPWRLRLQNSANSDNDAELKAGWYRVDGPAGQRLLDIADLQREDYFEAKADTFRPCGLQPNPHPLRLPSLSGAGIEIVVVLLTEQFYVLSEPHPLQGSLITTMVSCRYNATQRDSGSIRRFPNQLCKTNPNKGENICHWKAECGFSQLDVRVTNCGDFYVYFLQPTKQSSLRPGAVPPGAPFPKYCTTKNETIKEMECQNYVNITDASRSWDSKSQSLTESFAQSCQDKNFPFQWTRIVYDNITNGIIPDTCVAETTNTGNPPCGALYRGWLTGGYPSVKDGRVTREICFSVAESCKCLATMRIDVKNCGGFYIYKKSVVQPRCYARICSQKQTTAIVPTLSSTPTKTKTNFIKNSTKTNNTMYTTITPNTTANMNTATKTKTITTTTMPTIRYVNLCKNYATIIDDTNLFSNLERGQCDFYYKKAVRFMTSDGKNLQLKESCTPQDINTTRFFCGGNGFTYMEQKHPNITDMPVTTTVCMRTFFDPVRFNNFPNPSCQCHNRQIVLVQNCSGFYVYKLDPVAHAQLECPARYCTENLKMTVPTEKPTTTDKTTTVQSQVTYAVEGSLQIKNPRLNFRKLEANDLKDQSSRDYMFLMALCYDLLNHGLANVKNIKSRKITKLRLGSLIADYVIKSDKPIDTTTLDRQINDALKDRPNVDVKTDSRSFSGDINTETQALKDFNECSSDNSCDKNARCINVPATLTFQCVCNDNYTGDGFTCKRNAVTITEVDNKWSNDAIIAVSVLFSTAFVVVVLLSFAVCLLCKNKHNSYETSKQFDQNNYDQYLKSDHLDSPIDATKLNMYVAVDPVTYTSFQNEMESNNGSAIKNKHTT